MYPCMMKLVRGLKLEWRLRIKGLGERFDLLPTLFWSGFMKIGGEVQAKETVGRIFIYICTKLNMYRKPEELYKLNSYHAIPEVPCCLRWVAIDCRYQNCQPVFI